MVPTKWPDSASETSERPRHPSIAWRPKSAPGRTNRPGVDGREPGTRDQQNAGRRVPPGKRPSGPAFPLIGTLLLKLPGQRFHPEKGGGAPSGYSRSSYWGGQTLPRNTFERLWPPTRCTPSLQVPWPTVSPRGDPPPGPRRWRRCSAPDPASEYVWAAPGPIDLDPLSLQSRFILGFGHPGPPGFTVPGEPPHHDKVESVEGETAHLS